MKIIMVQNYPLTSDIRLSQFDKIYRLIEDSPKYGAKTHWGEILPTDRRFSKLDIIFSNQRWGLNALLYLLGVWCGTHTVGVEACHFSNWNVRRNQKCVTFCLSSCDGFSCIGITWSWPLQQRLCCWQTIVLLSSPSIYSMPSIMD